jgi:hypothetical protein
VNNGHGDPGSSYGPRWELPVSHVADGVARIEEMQGYCCVAYDSG